MPILLALGALLVIALAFGPQWWIKRVLAKHGVDRPDLPGTGAELARHLLDEANLPSVIVEPTDKGDQIGQILSGIAAFKSLRHQRGSSGAQ